MGKAREIASGVYQVSALGVAVTILEEGPHVALLDAGVRIAPRLVEGFLTSQGRHPKQVSHILVTHYHPDHIGGLARLKAMTGARIAAHSSEAPHISGAQSYPNPASSPALRGIFFLLGPVIRPRPVPVDILLQDGARLDIQGGIEAIHTPGHTPGSLSYFLPTRGMLFVGDALQRWWGRLGPPSPWFTQDMTLARASIKRLAQLDVETLCFSHFPPIVKGAKRELEELVERLC